MCNTLWCDKLLKLYHEICISSETIEFHAVILFFMKGPQAMQNLLAFLRFKNFLMVEIHFWYSTILIPRSYYRVYLGNQQMIHVYFEAPILGSAVVNSQ